MPTPEAMRMVIVPTAFAGGSLAPFWAGLAAALAGAIRPSIGAVPIVEDERVIRAIR